MDLSATLLGLGCAVGVVLIIEGLRRRPAGPAATRASKVWTASEKRLLLIAAVAGLAVAVATRWPAAALLTAAAVWTLPSILGPDREHHRAVARIEAIATWTELLRDTLSSAAGLEQAISATAVVAPTPIRPQVQTLASAVRGGVRLPQALLMLANDIADPTADLVVRALIQASSHRGGQLTECLTSLATTARDQASVRLRVATKRASTRTAARVVAGTAVTMMAALVVLNRGFLVPYSTVTGQLVLLLVGAVFGGGFFWLGRTARIPQPPRILAGVKS
jgi:tight adherence protein B